MMVFTVQLCPRAIAHGVVALALCACSESSPKAMGDTSSARIHASNASPSVSPTVRATAAAVDVDSNALHAATPRNAGAKLPAGPGAATHARARRIEFGGVDFTGVGYDRGNANAPVVVIDLSDFACPYCGEFAHDVFPTIDRDYVQTGKVLFKYIPFVAGSFRHATEATRAAECSADQGQFWVMMERLYITQAEWKSGNVADAQMAALAGTMPLDSVKFASCYASRRTDARTARATAVADEIGVRVTPSFLVDGHPVQGALPLAEFRKQIETALLVASTRKPGGTTAP